jgi:GDP-L-fucose synthase
MLSNSKIYVAGHRGMIGSTLMSKLIEHGFANIATKNSDSLDLKNQQLTHQYLMDTKPEYIFLIAAKVGGIQANIDNPATFLYENLMIQSNVIESARRAKVKKLLFLGSSCIYPRLSKQPMLEDYLLRDRLEPTNESYAIAKISGIKLCHYYKKQYNCNFFSIIPPNIYGPNDNFSLKSSHVVSALIRKIHEAKIAKQKSLTLWGSGIARRELMYNEDLAEGLISIMGKNIDFPFFNFGIGNDITIQELAELIKEIINYKGDFSWDNSKPDGMPQKLMDSSIAHSMGLKAMTSLEIGIKKTYNWFLENES